METDFLMGMEIYFVVMKYFRNWIEVVIAQHCECTKCHWKVYLKMAMLRSVSPQLKKGVCAHTCTHNLHTQPSSVPPYGIPAELPGVVSPSCTWFPACNRWRTKHTFAHGEPKAEGQWNLIKVMLLGSGRCKTDSWVLLYIFAVNIRWLLTGWQKLTNWRD